jgi:hypothetical protein
MAGSKRDPWVKPCIEVLARTDGAEAVLLQCKITGSVGSTAVDAACHYHALGCGQCSADFAS